MREKISAATIVRTISLFLAFTNQILTIAGMPVLPIEDETINMLVTSTWTIVSAIYAWWYNNSFTQAAIKADKVFEAQRGKGA